MLTLILIILTILGVTIFLVYATRKKWISWKAGSGIAFLTAFHDFAPSDKQAAIEVVIEQKAGKKLVEQKTGEDKDPGKEGKAG
jgi:hypothetical protein